MYYDSCYTSLYQTSFFLVFNKPPNIPHPANRGKATENQETYFLLIRETLNGGVRWSLVPANFCHLVPGPSQFLPFGPWSQPHFAIWSPFSLYPFPPVPVPSPVVIVLT